MELEHVAKLSITAQFVVVQKDKLEIHSKAVENCPEHLNLMMITGIHACHLHVDQIQFVEMLVKVHPVPV